MAEPAVYGDREVMLKDHAATMDLYKALVDIRFKLLTFVPTVTTVAVGIISMNRQQSDFDVGTTLFIGVAGVLASWAIVLYEVRNSQIHDRAIHRIKHLETVLGFVPSYGGASPRGMFNERGEGKPFIRLLTAKHDVALSMIYGVVLTLWTWVLLSGLKDFVGWFEEENDGPGLAGKIAISVGVGLVAAAEITRQGGMGREGPIVYTLADVVPAEKAGSRSEAERGELLWRALMRILNSLPEEEKRQQSLQQFSSRIEADNCISKALDTNKLLELAVAAEVIVIEQRSRPPWNARTDEKRKVRRRVARRSCPTPVTLARAMLGGQEVFDSLVHSQRSDGRLMSRQAKHTELVRHDLIQRYGVNAPWCTDEEVRLRWGLLAAARKAFAECDGKPRVERVKEKLQ